MKNRSNTLWPFLVSAGVILILFGQKKLGAISVMAALACCFHKQDDESTFVYVTKVAIAIIGEIAVFCINFL